MDKDKSYYTYLDACRKFGVKSMTEEEYQYTINDALSRLMKMTPDSGKHPFIVYNVNGLRIKIKQVGNNAQINFFSEEQFKDIVSKYKED